MFEVCRRKAVFDGLAQGVLLTALWLSLSAAASASQTVTLAWNADLSTNGNVGYLLFYGTNTGAYSGAMDVSTNASATVSNLAEGGTYYFSVIAYDANGGLSTPSEEIAYLVPGILKLQPRQNPASSMNMRFPVVPGFWYEVQASVDLQSWTTIWEMGTANGNSWMACQDPLSGSYSSRFYRSVGHLSSALPPPSLQSVNQAGAAVTVTWSALSGQSYQVQGASYSNPNNWINLGGVVTAGGSVGAASVTVDPNLQWFYRVVLAPAPPAPGARFAESP
jgi:hypothetical protein